MKTYLESKIGKRIGITRVGMPKEVYFEGVVKEIVGEVVIIEDDEGRQYALPVDKVLIVGPAEEKDKPPAGF